jgi:starvation-inducible outer membrane lipoprotein
MRSPVALIVVICLALMGCGTSPRVLTGSQHEAEKAGDEAQRVADEYRRAGASDAAIPAQQRADKYRLEAARPAGSLLERVVDAVFWSWIASTAPTSNKR